jgi:hypothetical protein
MSGLRSVLVATLIGTSVVWHVGTVQAKPELQLPKSFGPQLLGELRRDNTSDADDRMFGEIATL